MNLFAVAGLVPAFLIGTLAWLATGRSDAVGLLTCGILLLVIDGSLRLRRRTDVQRWLIASQAGGVLFVFPIWTLGVVQIGASLHVLSNSTPQPAARVTPVSAGSVRAPTDDAAVPKAANPVGSAELAYAVVENIELVPYCLPYPARMKEDARDRGTHGRHAFVSAGSATKLVFDTSCGPRSHAELHMDDVAKLRAERPNVTFDFDSLRSDGYVISWHAGRALHFGRVWTAPDEDGCFVRAILDSDEGDRPTFDAVVRKLTSASPRCADR